MAVKAKKAAAPSKKETSKPAAKASVKATVKAEKKGAPAKAPAQAPAPQAAPAGEGEEDEEEAAGGAGGGNAAAIAAASGSTEMSASFKNFRHHPDMENFYRFIYENDLRHEALQIIDEIMAQKLARRQAKSAKAAAH